MFDVYAHLKGFGWHVIKQTLFVQFDISVKF